MKYNNKMNKDKLQLFHGETFKKSFLVFSTFWILTCGEKITTKKNRFFKAESKCQSYLIQKEYLVSWKNGNITVEKSSTDETFHQNFLKQYDSEIVSSEPHYRLYEEFDSPNSHWKIKNPHHFQDHHIDFYSKSNRKRQNFLINWGYKKIGGDFFLKKNIENKNPEKVIVALIDSGIDITRPEFHDIIEINEEDEMNGFDEDKNRFPDDHYGVNFINKTDEIKDYTGHGTHKAGIMAARHDKGIIKGVAPHIIKILPLIFMDETGSGSVKMAVEALRYASQRGAKVINASWGHSMACSNILKNEIHQLAKKNILVITPAGNEGLNLEENPMFPASFGLSNVIVVGASTPENEMAPFSNYGSSVDLVAPGTHIFSTYPLEYDKDGLIDGIYSEDGTSSAVAFVSAAIALLWSEKPKASYLEIKQALLKGTTPGPYRVNTGGHLHIPGALRALNL